MDRNVTVAALAPALFLFACDQAVDPDDGPQITEPTASPNVGQTVAPAPVTPPVLTRPVADGSNEGSPNLTPPALTPEAERGVKGARNVLLSFARALELKEFDQGWALLSPADRERWSQADFARNFAGLDAIAVTIPDGESDGAAGSIYYRAPIAIAATDTQGRPVRYEGEAVLKRVNDVDGATAAQLRWHFDKLTLDWTH